MYACKREDRKGFFVTVTKYSGNGNDFVMFVAQEKEDRSQLAKTLCHRQNGVGADGLVVLLPHKEYDFEWEFYNSDGSQADMCGNASRCVAHFAHEKGISKNNHAEFLTGAGVIRATINGLYVVSDMTEPDIIRTDIEENGENWWLIDSGVPHLVAVRDNIDTFNLEEARALRHKYNANVNICKLEGDTMYVRTYERGVEDETLACGTGMVACFIRNHKEGKVSNQVKVHPISGDELYVSYEEGTYRFGGQVTKTFVAETLI
jgi:diaminopimelate epimerase